jgi:energy-coupling factor transporter ATP-binding protein EcfA2
MHVREITVTDVRQFGERTFVFRPGFNLLVGENGAGKTTLLRAVLTVLGGFVTSRVRASLGDEDIRLGSRSLRISANISDATGLIIASSEYEKSFGQRARRSGDKNHGVVLLYGSNEATCKSFVSQRIRRYSAEAIDTTTASDEEWLYEREATPRPGEAVDRFGHSQAIRDFVLRILKEFSDKFTDFRWRFAPYACSIRSKEGSDFDRDLIRHAERTLATAIMRSLQERRNPLGAIDQPRVEIDSEGYTRTGRRPRRVIPSFNELLKGTDIDKRGISHLARAVAELRLTPRITIRTATGEFLLEQLSDGEKRLFSLFVDIARHLSLHHPLRRLTETAAIVLIDEIDVHLHPKWQRMIVPALERLFPNCQFIATTHSPFVVQAVREDEVQHLDRAIFGDFADRGIEEIAVKVMGIVNPQVSPRYLDMLNTAKEYFTLLEHAQDANIERRARLRARLQELSQRYAHEPAYQAYLELYGKLALDSPSE